jgi:DNA-binding Xre family transcriptional regulator
MVGTMMSTKVVVNPGEAARRRFAENVRRQRGERTQEMIEARGGPEQSRLSRIERGEIRFMSWDTLVDLCIALDCRPSHLFAGLDDVVVADSTT